MQTALFYADFMQSYLIRIEQHKKDCKMVHKVFVFSMATRCKKGKQKSVYDLRAVLDAWKLLACARVRHEITQEELKLNGIGSSTGESENSTSDRISN